MESRSSNAVAQSNAVRRAAPGRLNEKGARIANVGEIREGDHVVVAWRHSSVTRTAYLECTVAEPLSPVAPGLVIDKLAGPSAQILVSAGYPQNSAGEVEGVRLDDIRECYFQVQGKYGGNNAIHINKLSGPIEADETYIGGKDIGGRASMRFAASEANTRKAFNQTNGR